MKTKIILIVCTLLLPGILCAQRVNEYGQKLNRWGRIIVDLTATEEKKSLTLREFNVLNASDSDRGFWDKSNDILIVDEKEYAFSQTPITALFSKAGYMLYEDDEIGLHGVSGKRYTLTWEVKNDSLYIVDYDIAPDYRGNKTKEDVRKEIERLWGKKFKNGELNVDWMSVPIVHLFIRDNQVNVYSLVFKRGIFDKIEERNDLTVRKIQMKEDCLYTNADYQPWVDRLRRVGLNQRSLGKGLQDLGLPLPEILPKK